ncbi:MAG: AzlD domain-containing protein [Actinobacteria bacterium]|nr:AzlD domain-containing protein [Actinomycetota bacterium]
MRLLAAFVAMGAVTYFSRLLPLFVLAHRTLPPRVLRFLEAVPVAVLAAFVAPLVLAPEGVLDISLSNQGLLVTLPTVLIAAWSRSLILTVVAGSLLMMALRAFA